VIPNTVGFFLQQTIFSKIHHKQEIFSDEFPLFHFENVLQPKTGCKKTIIIIMFILTKVKIKILIEI
jgi:hypothetical protein